MAANLRKRTSISYCEAELPHFSKHKICDADRLDQNDTVLRCNDSGRTLRQRPRISYYEPEEPSFDEYSFCEECSDYVFEYCAIHGPLLVIPDDKVPAKPNVPPVVPRAALTIPHVFLHLAPSIIPGAGIGVFSTLTLPRGVRFGPYRGQRAHSVDSMYCWQIYDRNNKRSHVVDAADSQRSNWMRYVNCARHWTEQNLVAYQYKGQLYYRTIKVIPRFTELLVFYGSEFANILHVNLSKYNSAQYYEEIINISSKKTEDNPSIASSENSIMQLENHQVFDIETHGTDELLKDLDFQIIDNNLSTENLIDGRAIDNNTNFITYARENHQIKDSNNEQTTFRCDKCSKTFAKKKYLSTHSLIHLDTQKYQCSECSYGTSLSHSFKRHLQSHAKRTIYSCNECIYETDNKHHLIRHGFQHKFPNIASMRSYYAELKQCEICSFNTYSKKSFQTHMVKHKGEIYKCNFCDYNSNFKEYLRRHILRQHGGKK